MNANLKGTLDLRGNKAFMIGPGDPTSRRLLESMLAPEEEHAEGRVDLLEDLPKD